MARSRDKVQQQGFWDAEVTKPGHDAVVVWVDDNADVVMRTAFPELYGRGWLADDVEWGVDDARRAEAEVEVAAFMEGMPRPDPRVRRTTWEHVLREEEMRPRYQPRSVGFADLIIEAERPMIYVRQEDAPSRRLSLAIGWFRIGGHHGVLVEAKSALPTRGDLIRQLRHYGTVFRGPMVVVSPDDTYAKLLAAQGFRFVRCPSALD
ncbi:hypothetical protein RHOFW510R12_00435 [Rhodanobacter sp. FW510-R12]